MADITETTSWERVVPALGNNRELEKPFYLLVKSSLTITERDAFEERLTACLAENPDAEKFAAFMGEWVRMGDEPLSVKGEAVATLADYLRLLEKFAGMGLWLELIGSVRYVNSAEGSKALFLEARFGGLAFMTLPISAKATPTKARR